jgi:hypothetical protein
MQQCSGSSEVCPLIRPAAGFKPAPLRTCHARLSVQVFIANVNGTLHELLGAVDAAVKDFHVLVPDDKLLALKDRVEVGTASDAQLLMCRHCRGVLLLTVWLTSQ